MDINVGFLGCGNIGCGTWRLLQDMEQEIYQRTGITFHVVRVLVRNKAKQRKADVPSHILTENPEDIFSDKSISLVCEFMGGENPAADYMLRALSAGKTVVTANKVALCLHMEQLFAAAKTSGAGLYYEASVCGAVPVISSLTSPLLGNRITRIMGIINGTTNYILTAMSKTGAAYGDVLSKAQQAGLAEPDPSSDVEGTDAACKLAIMASLAFHTPVSLSRVYTEGISHVSAQDIAFGREMGYVLKLVATGKNNGGVIETRVHPTFLPLEHPLARVDGSLNAVFLQGHASGEMMLMGRGAGDYPTASAIVGDMISSVLNPPHYPDFSAKDVSFTEDWVCRCFIHLSADDKPGVLEKVAGALARQNVSIATMLQKGRNSDGKVPLILITHDAREQDMRRALASLDPAVCRVESMIRVEE